MRNFSDFLASTCSFNLCLGHGSIYTVRNFQREMNLSCLYFIQFYIKCNQIWHKQGIIHDTIHANDESVDDSHVYSTKRGHKRGLFK